MLPATPPQACGHNHALGRPDPRIQGPSPRATPSALQVSRPRGHRRPHSPLPAAASRPFSLSPTRAADTRAGSPPAPRIRDRAVGPASGLRLGGAEGPRPRIPAVAQGTSDPKWAQDGARQAGPPTSGGGQVFPPKHAAARSPPGRKGPAGGSPAPASREPRAGALRLRADGGRLGPGAPPPRRRSRAQTGSHVHRPEARGAWWVWSLGSGSSGGNRVAGPCPARAARSLFGVRAGETAPPPVAAAPARNRGGDAKVTFSKGNVAVTSLLTRAKGGGNPGSVSC